MLTQDSVNVDEFIAAKASDEQKDAQNNSQKKGFEKPDSTCLKNGYAIVRFVNGVPETPLDRGAPGSGRAKLFNVGWIRDDNNKPFRLVLPAIIKNKPQYDHTLLKFIDKVLSRAWVDGKNGEKGKWKYFYENRNDYGQQTSGEKTLKEIYEFVNKSGTTPDNQYYDSQKSWRGKTIYVANVIDRRDYEWHKEHKKTRLLMKSISVKDENINLKEISYYAVDTPLHEIAETHGYGLDYDVLITEGKEPLDKFGMKNVSKLKEVDYWDDVAKWIKPEERALIRAEKGFSAEEATWEPIDIDKYFKFTSAKAILAHLGKTIKAFDMMVGTNFYEQFEAEAKADGPSNEGESNEAVSQPTVPETSMDFESDEIPSEITAAPVSEAASSDIEAFYQDL